VSENLRGILFLTHTVERKYVDEYKPLCVGGEPVQSTSTITTISKQQLNKDSFSTIVCNR